MAGEEGQIEALQLLIDAGADLVAQNDEGRIPAETAILRGEQSAANILHEAVVEVGVAGRGMAAPARLEALGMPTVQSGVNGGKQARAHFLSHTLCLPLSTVMLFPALQAGIQPPGWFLGVPKKATASEVAAERDQRMRQASRRRHAFALRNNSLLLRRMHSAATVC